MQRVTLVDETATVDPGRLAAVAAALQVQLDRDLAPIWGRSATIYPGTRDTLGDAWRLSILSPARMPPGVEGVHLNGADAPFALVAMSERWTVTASHELLEMLVNPSGQNFVNAPSVEPAAKGRRAQYLHEVCDPCQGFSYLIDGVEVSDFVHANFYDIGGRFPVDQISALAGPLNVPPGGCLCWLDPLDNKWRQQRPDGSIHTVSTSDSLRPDITGRAARHRATGNETAPCLSTRWCREGVSYGTHEAPHTGQSQHRWAPHC